METLLNKEKAEGATGTIQQGDLQFYNDSGEKISEKKASKLFLDGEVVEVASAGAGSYGEVLELLGAEDVKVIDWTSSAGDWTFGVLVEGFWLVASQENRYPYHGFRYSMSRDIEGRTFEELCEIIQNY